MPADSFVAFYRRYYSLVLTVAQQRLAGVADAEDAAAEVFRIASRTMVRLAVAALLLGTLGIAPPAAASPGNMQQRIASAIEATPGGVQVSWNEVSWNNGEVVLTLAPETGDLTAVGEAAPAAAVGSCANDRHCVYSLSGLAGNKLTFTSCTSQGVGPLGAPVKSIANARTGVTVTAKNGTTVILTVGANSWANTSATITTVSC